MSTRRTVPPRTRQSGGVAGQQNDNDNDHGSHGSALPSGRSRSRSSSRQNGGRRLIQSLSDMEDEEDEEEEKAQPMTHHSHANRKKKASDTASVTPAKRGRLAPATSAPAVISVPSRPRAAAPAPVAIGRGIRAAQGNKQKQRASQTSAFEDALAISTKRNIAKPVAQQQATKSKYPVCPECQSRLVKGSCPSCNDDNDDDTDSHTQTSNKKRKSRLTDAQDTSNQTPTSKQRQSVQSQPKTLNAGTTEAGSAASNTQNSKPMTTSGGKLRRAATLNKDYTDPFDKDDERDEDYGPKRRRSASGSALKLSVRDGDLNRAIALSLATAPPAAIQHVANLPSATDAELKQGRSIWDENLVSDARHRNTLVTGMYLVHPTTSTPPGFQHEKSAMEREEKDGEYTSKKRHASSSDVTPPVLLRNGFASSYPSESVSSICRRSACFQSIWSHTHRQLQDVISSSEQGVFEGILRFVQDAFTDRGHAHHIDELNAQAIATNYVHPTKRQAAMLGPDAPSGHAVPVALVHAGLNVEDHALLMSSLACMIGDRVRERRQRNVASRLAAVRARRAAVSEAQKAEEEQRAASGTPRKKYTHESHYYRGLRDVNNLDPEGKMREQAEVERMDEEDDIEAEAFPQPEPFVITLPPTPPSLLSMLQSLYTSLTEAYPSPRSLSYQSRHQSPSHPSLSSRRLSAKHGAASGVASGVGVDGILDALQAWMHEHREEQRYKYDQWNRNHVARIKKMQQQQQATHAGPVPMDIDGEEAESGTQQNAGENNKSAGQKKKRGALADVSSSNPSAEVDSESVTDADADADVPPSPSTASYPSYIYPKLLLLLPSLNRFPPAILSDFLLLLQTDARLSSPESTLQCVMVWPTGGMVGLVHSLLPKRVLDLVWFGVFQLPPTRVMLDQLVQRFLRTMHAPLLPCHIGTHGMTTILHHAYQYNTALANTYNIIKYVLLDICDANGAEYAQQRNTNSDESNQQQLLVEAMARGEDDLDAEQVQRLRERGCALSASYMRAWVRQWKRSQRALTGRDDSAVSSSSTSSASSRPDPVDAWIDGLTSADLEQIRSLPSVQLWQQRQAVAASPSSPPSRSASNSASSPIPSDDDELRSLVRDWVEDLQVHRWSIRRAAMLIHELCNIAGLYSRNNPASNRPMDGSAAPIPSSLASDIDCWLHLLSNPLFQPLPSEPSSTQPLLQLHPSSASCFAGLDRLLLRYEDPAFLRRALLKGLNRNVADMEEEWQRRQAQERMRMGEGQQQEQPMQQTPATRQLGKAIQKWKKKISELEASEHVVMPIPTPSSATSSASSRPSKASGSALQRRSLLLQPATARLDRTKASATAVLACLHSICTDLLAPMHTLPLSELICYEKAHQLRYLFQPQTEAAVHTALTNSTHYLGPPVEDEDELGRPIMQAQDENSLAAAASALPPLSLRQPLPASSSSSDSSILLDAGHRLEDMCVAYELLQRTSGMMVNLADWFQAFKATLTQGQRDKEQRKDEEQTQRQQDTDDSRRGAAKRTRRVMQTAAAVSSSASASASASSASSSSSASLSILPLHPSSLQVRFLTCLTTLANLGYIKPTKRRQDHVIKLNLMPSPEAST